MRRYTSDVNRYFRLPAAEVGTDLAGEAGSVEQGARIQVGANLVDGSLRQVGFRAFACPHIIAACHRAAELLEGETMDALLGLSVDDLHQQFEIPVEKAGKLLILKDALADCYASGESAGRQST